MSRYSRQIRVSAGLEASYAGSVSTWAPILWADGEPKFEIEGDMVDRKLVRDFLGASEQIPANARSKLTGTTELWAAGAAGTAPAWGPLMQMCGCAETITAGNRVEYTPVSDGFSSGGLKVNASGAQYLTKGNVGNAVIKLEAGQLPKIDWDFRGVRVSWSEVAFGAAQTMAAWKKPQVIRDENAGALLRGGTYAAGALSGGTAFRLRSMSFDLGNTIEYSEELTQSAASGQSQDIVNREVKGEVVFALTAAQEITIRDDIANGVESSLGFALGTASGNKLAIFLRAAQLINPQVESYNGKMLMRMGFRGLPSAAGNDEFKIAVL